MIARSACPLLLFMGAALIGCATSGTRSGEPQGALSTDSATAPESLRVSGGTVEPLTSLQGTRWRLEEIDGHQALSRAEASLRFADSGRVEGSGSCNVFSGSVRISGDSIAFGELEKSELTCPSEVSTQETSYLEALDSAERFEIDQAMLLIYLRDEEHPLRFSPVP